MKGDTHTKQEIEAKLVTELAILKDPNVGKDRKKEAMRTIKIYEKFLRDVDFKNLNGKKYPKEYLSWSDDKPMNVPELHKLIDSVDDDSLPCEMEMKMDEGIDLTGVSVGKDRFTFVDHGWKQPKHPFKRQ